MLKYLLEKEIKQFLRNRFLPKMVVMLPFAALAIFPLVANMEVKNLRLVVVDKDHSQLASRLVGTVTATAYFNLAAYADNSQDAYHMLEHNKADVVMEIPADFERDLTRTHSATLMCQANAVNGAKGGMAGAYLTQIVNSFNRGIVVEQYPQAATATAAIVIKPLFRYNPALDYTIFMIPALMAMMLAIIVGFLPALNIVSEKENGTIDQMNVTPVKRLTFIIAKQIPYWVAGQLVTLLCMLSALLFYGMRPAGSVWTILLFSLVFSLAFSGFGLIVSNYATNTQQAIFIMFFFVVSMVFLSGLYTPFQNMPQWAQVIGTASPLKHYIEALRMIYIKGAGLTSVAGQLGILILIAIVFNTWAVVSYHKR